MSRHKKLALLIAPLLILGGYIASDYYVQYQASQARVFNLETVGHCDIINQQCILQSGELRLNVFDQQGITQVNSTFALDSALLFLVNDKNQSTPHVLSKVGNPYYWQSKTALSELIGDGGANQKLRLIVRIRGGQYIAEFYSQTIDKN